MWVKAKTIGQAGDDYLNLDQCVFIAAHADGQMWSISVRDIHDRARQLDAQFATEQQADEAVRRLVNGINPQSYA